MTELQPLGSVLEQYKADTRTVVRLREEVRNLSGSLAAIQEEMGAYGYEDLQQRVLALEARLHACAQKLGTPPPCIAPNATSVPVFCGLFGFPYLEMLRAHSWGARGTPGVPGIEPGSASCEANALLAVPSLWPPQCPFFFGLFWGFDPRSPCTQVLGPRMLVDLSKPGPLPWPCLSTLPTREETGLDLSSPAPTRLTASRDLYS